MTDPSISSRALALRGLTVLTLLLAPVALSPQPADAAAPTCLGRRATIVGTPGQDVLGTAGPDVIVARRPLSVDAGAGADVVCVVVLPRAAMIPVQLGAGADVYLGSGPANVDAGDDLDVASGRPPSHDLLTVRGARGRARVGSAGQVDTDRVSMVSGSHLDLVGVPAGTYNGGRLGHPTSSVSLFDGGRHAWRIDERAHTGSVDGTAFTLTRFPDIDLAGLSWSSFNFRGTRSSDFFDARGGNPESGRLRVRLGRGNDVAALDPRQRGHVSGGVGGLDDLTIGTAGDRPRGRLDLGVDDRWMANGHRGARLGGFEQTDVVGVRTADVVGTSQADAISVNACRATVRGGDGPDDIQFSVASGCGHRHGAGPYRGFGGRGNDVLLGSPRRDILVGGPGQDRACGAGGRHDDIDAESRRFCR